MNELGRFAQHLFNSMTHFLCIFSRSFLLHGTFESDKQNMTSLVIHYHSQSSVVCFIKTKGKKRKELRSEIPNILKIAISSFDSGRLFSRKVPVF